MMEKKKFNFKKFVKDYSYQIGFAIGTTVLIGTGAWWLWHVKRNTEDLFVFDIPEGKCHAHYRQFGKKYMNAEASMRSTPVFLQGLLDSGNFKPEDRVFFMITDDKDLFK